MIFAILGSVAAPSTRKVVPLKKERSDNASLVAGLRAMEHWAAEEVYDRFSGFIHARVWKMLGADQDHDEVVHEVFINIVTSIRKLKEDDALVEWIRAVTYNTVLRELRSRRYKRRQIPMAVIPDEVECRGDFMASVLLGRAFSVLSEMDPEEHSVFVLRFVEGYSLEEVAQLCSCSLATAKRRIRSAREEFSARAGKDPVLSSRLEELSNA